MRQILIFVLICIVHAVTGQNLIINPGAELDPATNGWTMAAGTVWTRSAEVTPHEGVFHFFAGGTPSIAMNELTQDVDVSPYSGNIDAGLATFTFSAWMRVFNFDFSAGKWNDQSRVMIEYLDAGGTMLAFYDTGLRNVTSWTQYTDSKIAPVGTRTIRIHLYSSKQAGSDSDGYIDDLSLTYSGPLPVQLISFSANATGDAVILSWQTASEKSNAYYTLERSVDATTWEVIGVQNGVVNSSQVIQYQYADVNISDGIYYYRLSQTDLDGTITQFPIQEEEVKLNEPDNTFVLYPNPSTGPVNIASSDKGLKYLRVYEMQGGEIINEMSFDTLIYELNFSGFSAGSYVIELQTSVSLSRQLLIIE